MIKNTECRAARALLNWSREKLADLSGISTRTLVDFERGVRKPLRNNLLAIENALRQGGVTISPKGCICPHLQEEEDLPGQPQACAVE